MGDFNKLAAWREGHAFTRAVYLVFRVRRANDYPGLRAQILRAAKGIPSCLAEGCAKRSRRELARFADMAYSSAKEIESDLIFSRDIGIISSREFEDLAKKLDDVAKLSYGLTNCRLRNQVESLNARWEVRCQMSASDFIGADMCPVSTLSEWGTEL